MNLAEPVLTFAADAVKWWSEWPGLLKGASLAALALVAAIGPALLIGGTLLSSWATLTLAFPALAGALGTVGAAAKIMWIAFTGPIGLVIAGIAAVSGAIFYFREELGLVGPAAAESIGEAEERVRSLATQVENSSGHMRRNLTQDLAAARAELGELLTAEQEAGWAAYVASEQARVLAETLDVVGQAAIPASEEIAALELSFDAFTAGTGNSQKALLGFVGSLGLARKGLEPLPPAADLATMSFDKFKGGTHDSQNSMMGFLGTLSPVNDGLEEVASTAGNLDVTLAALSGQIGGASGQAINLFTSMQQSNAALEEGEKGFGKARMGAALLSGVMSDLADVVGGTAGEILNAASNIASAFATGGPVAGAIAAVSEGIKGLFSLFGVSGLEQEGRKSAEAARDAIADTLNDGQMAEAAGNAGNAVHIAIRDAMIASGESIAYAEASATELTRALWRAEKEGGPAVDAVRDRILGIVGASSEAAVAAAELADTIESLGDELAQLDRNIRLREIEANIEALETELEAELEIVDVRIAATEQAKIAAMEAINLQIAGVKELTAARLTDLDVQLTAARGAVVDVSSTKGIADRLKIDLSNATVFGAQEASERITALAEDIATLQKAGVSVTAGLSEEFDAELRAAVSSVNRFGVTVPESLQTIVSTFPDIEIGAIAFGDGLTEAARRVKELEEARDAIQLEANERLAELALERQGIEEEFDEALLALAEERQGIEELFTGAIAVLTTERETIEDSMVESIADMRIRRVEVEGELNDAISLAASNAAAAAARIAPAPQQYHDPYDDYDEDDEDGFRGGTRGRYIDFGRSSTIKVHGKERIVTESEGRREAENNAASLRGVEDRLDRLDTNLQRAIKRISTDVTNVVLTKSL